jgi:aryl-alcohol dehydrogenase-like predicted oxidoreductase
VLNQQVRAGRLRAFGGSNWSAARVDSANAYAAQHGLQGFGLLSNQFSLARMVEPPWDGCISASTPEMQAWLRDRRVALLAWSSQARGFFLPQVTPDYRADPELARCWFAPDNFHRRRRAQTLAERQGVSMLNIALAYVLAQPFPTFALIGPRSLHELRTSLPALRVTLTADDLVFLAGK